eukprot:TRINITY_DN1862_c0_g1_i2.p1 TRINITY_DN1862_c0_g1~~TRINITY_DN1862_c0_g1_i2.p1  ORF type:complete len:222 (-),score=36.06 TRINITY_DN1862_c0_g1_i2:366-1031(-)
MDGIFYPANRWWWTGYNWKALADSLDFLVPMMYDGLNADACSRGDCRLPPGYSRYAQSALPAHQQTVEQFARLGVPPSKLVMAVPWYGYSIPCSSQNRSLQCQLPVPWPSDPVGGWPCGSLPDPWCTPKQVPYRVIQRLLASPSAKWEYDPGSVTAFIEAENITGGRMQIWFDDAATLGVKARWLRSAGVRGIGMWTASSVNYSASRDGQEMWNALKMAVP